MHGRRVGRRTVAQISCDGVGGDGRGCEPSREMGKPDGDELQESNTRGWLISGDYVKSLAFSAAFPVHPRPFAVVSRCTSFLTAALVVADTVSGDDNAEQLLRGRAVTGELNP